LILTPGNTADCTVGPACVSLLDGIAELLGDKAYDSNSFRKSLRKDGIKPVIPGRSNRKKRIRHDKQAYKDRNVIERCYLQAQGLQAHRNALRQTRSELLLSPVPRCRRGILALVVRGFRFWDIGTRMTTGNHEGEVGMSSQRVSGTAVQRTIAVLGSAVFFVVAPFTLAGLVPWSITGWQLRPPFLGLELTRGIGAIMILAGVPGLVDAFARFALQGLGTPAPIAPPRNLVVTGLYRYVRNPIYVAVVAIILGQAVLMGDWRLIVYGALLWLFFHVFVVAYEEPTLERTFGREYEAFRAAVPRWIPRMTPWRSK